MNADFYFESGLGKHICQDYAVAGIHKGIAYAIGSDGCSSSPDTDIGARLISLTARSISIPSWQVNPILDTASKIIGSLVTDRCQNLWRQLNVPPNMFDATLWIILWPENGNPVVMGWGDGVIIADYGDHKKVVKHEYPYNAPLYLTYDIQEARKAEHYRQYGALKSVLSEWELYRDLTSKLVLQTELKWDTYFARTFAQEGLVSIAVCSDGINTYMDNQNVSIPFWEMAIDFTAYKILGGEFVKRRMGKLSKELITAGVHHYDDVFCASIAR